jgi:drug/metabolite transporter (DMT)-like permease
MRVLRMGLDVTDSTPSHLHIVLTLLFAVSMVSSASILIRFSHSDPLVIVFWRTFYGAIVMASLCIARNDAHAFHGTLMKKNWCWLIAIGVILAFHFSTWFTSLSLTTVAASVVLVNISPIFTAILSTVILGEALGRRSWIGTLVAVAGALILAWNDLVSVGAGALDGDLLALLGGLFLAIYFIGGRRYAKGLPISVYTTVVYITAAAVTLAECLVLGINVIVLDPTEIVIFIALAIFPTALGHSVNNYLLTLVPAYVVSSAVLGEPIGATILAAIFLQEIPTPITFVGFFIILGGVALVLLDIAAKERRRTRLSLDHT